MYNTSICVFIDNSEKFKNICESVDIAKEAVSLDVSDGKSWRMS